MRCVFGQDTLLLRSPVARMATRETCINASQERMTFLWTGITSKGEVATLLTVLYRTNVNRQQVILLLRSLGLERNLLFVAHLST